MKREIMQGWLCEDPINIPYGAWEGTNVCSLTPMTGEAAFTTTIV